MKPFSLTETDISWIASAETDDLLAELRALKHRASTDYDYAAAIAKEILKRTKEKP